MRRAFSGFETGEVPPSDAPAFEWKRPDQTPYRIILNEPREPGSIELAVCTPDKHYYLGIDAILEKGGDNCQCGRYRFATE